MPDLHYEPVAAPAAANPTTRKPSRFAPLLWAVFLGCSWTWVIGMFMPVLLVRDYGVWAWAVFAIPNVVGAAAMGWALCDAAASERFVRNHAAACHVFSLVTIAFHLFFAAWMLRRIGGVIPLAAVMLLGLVAAAVMGGTLGRWIGALGALLISLAAWNALYGQDALALPTSTYGRNAGSVALAYIAPVFVLGFALNPYLDLTFHRARRSTSRGGGRFAFGFGFGVVFCSMIVFTLLYARFLAPAVDGQALSLVMTAYLCAHLVAQSAFTIGAHLRELPESRQLAGRPAWLGTAAMATLLLVALALGWYASTPRLFRGRDLGEVIYWCFLGFYGLVFPGYVWLFAMPRRTPTTAYARRRALSVLGAVVVIAFPMYWMAFVEGRHLWLVPGLLVLLLSRALVPRPSSDAGDVDWLADARPSGEEPPVRQSVQQVPPS